MSQPRITVTIGRDGKRVGRRVSVTTDMYADRANGGNNTRKRSIRDRLGGNVEQLAPVRQPNTKRLREDDGKWKHDLYEDMEEANVQGINGQISSQDLRSKLARPNLRIVRLRKGGSSLGVMDLREKLSGSTSQRPPVSQAQGGGELQRRLTSVVRNSSNGAQTAPRAPAPLLKQTASVTRTPAAGSEQTVAGLLHSLGLGKYSLIFQAEEVDMAALRHMSDSDLKELAVPMGPRKKILLALGRMK
ncbi:unnamed protein product [Sphagnum troendelagicum]|uniref:SAM domain-containing protein n=1 Tax=Sphagnum troendelagicum TaxID=128251 RepID=A0ABP0U251_9BRYO